MKNLIKTLFQESKENKKSAGYPNIVYKIHKEFNTASQRLLNEANEILAKYSGVDTSKGQRLANAGFSSTKETTLHLQVEKEKRIAKENAERVFYCAQKYLHKFITEDQVKAVCEKYGLLCGSVSDFIGFVPDKNLKEIENFKINVDDIKIDWRIEHNYIGSSNPHSFRTYDSALEYKNQIDSENKLRLGVYKKYCFKICAPLKDFNITRKRVSGYNLIEDDPIVLAPVKGGGYLIVTAWGDEASDPIVVNSKMN